MKIIKPVVFFLTSFVSLAQAFPGQSSGEVTLELRSYPNEGLIDDQPESEASLLLKPEISHSWDNDRKVITFIPYARINSEDQEKTHLDIRELSYVASFNQFEFRVGISKVFWGVTESQHLVDVINQTDFVENPDGEEKLGQLMFNTTYVSDLGNFDLFILPYFRERTFSGKDGRFRTETPVANNEAIYLADEEEKHIDYAFRWSHYYKDLEWGLSYFKGTDREPIFTSKDNELIPTYGLSEQFGLELQYVYTDWLFKFEGIKKDSDTNNDYHQSVGGVEYTFGNVYNGKDIGFIYEWQWDERQKLSPTGSSNASFFATRLAFNDAASSELLAGGIINNNDGHYMSTRIEASRRIKENLKVEFELNIIDSPPKGTLLDSVKEDDYTQLSLSYFW